MLIVFLSNTYLGIRHMIYLATFVYCVLTFLYFRNINYIIVLISFIDTFCHMENKSRSENSKTACQFNYSANERSNTNLYQGDVGGRVEMDPS